MEPVLLFSLSCGTAMSVLWLWVFRQRLTIRAYAVFPIALAHTVLGVLCVSLFAGLESFRLTITGGMSLYGAIFLLPLCYWLGGRLFHRDLRHVFDVMTLCMISTLIFARINCLVSGCCRGLLLPGSNVLRWPTREAEMLFHVVLLVLFVRRLHRQEQPGTIYPLYLICYGVFRFILEWFREDKRMYLAEYFPGISLDTIRERTGFPMDLSRAVEARPPERDVLKILLEKVDPMRIMV